MDSPADPATNAPTLCLLNRGAHSGAAEQQRHQVAEAFAHFRREIRIEMPEDCDRMEALAREAARAGASVVIAGGGDGTMNAVANALAGTQTALAVLPLGTLNHFAKDLGIPLEIGAAAENAFQGVPKCVDVADVNGRVFINNSSIGLYPQIVREREALQEKGQSKWVAFGQAAVKALGRTKAMQLQITAFGRTRKTRTEFVFIGNNEYVLAAPRIGARLRMDGGVLWVYRLPHTGRFRAILATLRAFVALDKPRAPIAFSTPELRIALRKPRIDVALDGEVTKMQTPLVYRSRPGALRVIVPVDEGT